MATNVGSVSSASSSSSVAAAGTQSLGKDDFLKLLIAQMSNQDPLNPMDNSQMITQLAQFSSVEQIQGVNDRLDTLTLAQAAANQTQASVLVGKAVSYKTSQLNHTSGVPTPISAQIQGTPSSMTAVITDSQGRTVRTLNFGAQVPGPFTGTWDGRDLSGAEVPSGAYSVKLIATDASGNVIPTTTQASGKVTGINFVGGSPQLLVNGTQVPLGSVIEINQAV